MQLLPALPAGDDEARLFADVQVLRDPEAGEITCRSPPSNLVGPGSRGGGPLLVRTADLIDSGESVTLAGFIPQEGIISVHEDGEAEKPVRGGARMRRLYPLPVPDVGIYLTWTSQTDPRSPFGPSDVRHRDS